MKYKSHSAIAAFLLALLLPSIATAQLQWFGYAGTSNAAMLDRTAPYINFGYFSTDSNPASQNATFTVNLVVQRDMKAIVELGKLLWYPGSGLTYRTLYPDFRARWNTWKEYNAGILTSDKILAFLIRDEPFHNQVNIDHYEMAAQMVKQDFPWAKIIMTDAAVAVYSSNTSTYFNQWRSRMNTVDWIGVDRYAIDPTTDTIFRTAVTRMKQSFPGRKFIYVADGFWDDEHRQAFATTSLLVMRDVMTKWYDVARNDPDAVLLGVFIWAGGSENFPQAVLDEHFRVGKAITGRVRTQLYQPVGLVEGFDENLNLVGWACDPDAKWGEKVTVEIREPSSNYLNLIPADLTSEFFPQCNSAGHRFRLPLSTILMGKTITVHARDLDSGSVQVPSTCVDTPGCTWYANDYQPIGQFRISSTGFAEGWTCDPDAPQASIKFEVRTHSDSGSLTLIGIFTANLTSDGTINGQCGGGAAHRFGVQLPSWTKGRGTYITGIDTMYGSVSLLADPSANCPGLGVCTW